MTASDAFPSLRAEFTDDTEWGALSQLQRYEVGTPDIPGPIESISQTVGCIHARRASLIVRIGGGHLRAPTEGLLKALLDEAPAHLDALTSGPAKYIANVVSWLEEEQRSGFLERSYTTASLVVAVSDSEAWTWLMSPHGLLHGPLDGVVFGSTDLRYPVLRQLGVMSAPAYRFPGTGAGDQASSVCCIGTPDNYERIQTHVAPGKVAVALERGSLPFGPWPVQPITLQTLWGMDAAWKHGLPGRGVVLGQVKAGDLALPHDWYVREVPLV